MLTKNDIIECMICKKETKLGSLNKHITNYHKDTTAEEYFLKYLTINEFSPNCPICGVKRKFKGIIDEGNLTGYKSTCGKPSCNAKMGAKTTAQKISSHKPAEDVKATFIFATENLNSLKDLIRKTIKTIDSKGIPTYFKHNHTTEYWQIMELTKDLKNTKQIYLIERFYCVLNDITIRPICKINGPKCKQEVRFLGLEKGYGNYCQPCINLDKNIQSKRQQNYTPKYGFSIKKLKGK